MWFLNDITIKKIESNENKVREICNKNNINIGIAYYKRKTLGNIISDSDYLTLIDKLKR